ncbi:hypothetical protein [Halomonas sp. A29]|uniref:hypothetical protein n=1 Tax=Halomonas sp. A29 TaxID=3102786 RepID=UPI00398B9C43
MPAHDTFEGVEPFAFRMLLYPHFIYRRICLIATCALHAISGLVLVAAQTVTAQTADRQPDFGTEYTAIGYTGTPEQNPIAQLAARLGSGECNSNFSPPASTWTRCLRR